MERLTYERNDGIRTKYVSPARRELLIQRLAEYENTGLNPEEVKDVARVCKIYKSVGLTPDRVRELDERDTAKKIKLIIVQTITNFLICFSNGVFSLKIEFKAFPILPYSV